MSKRYVVAVSQWEAEMLDAKLRIGHDSRAEAEQHLKDCQAPPTDPHYARQFKVFVVAVDTA